MTRHPHQVQFGPNRNTECRSKSNNVAEISNARADVISNNKKMTSNLFLNFEKTDVMDTIVMEILFNASSKVHSSDEGQRTETCKLDKIFNTNITS